LKYFRLHQVNGKYTASPFGRDEKNHLHILPNCEIDLAEIFPLQEENSEFHK
jgi:hypothetical protein